MTRYSARNYQYDSEVDLTPMLDIVFIMLIFFVVTATFIRESGLDINVPAPTNDHNISQNIVFTVSGDNEIRLAGRSIDKRSIRNNIEQLRAENPLASVVILASPAAKANTYVSIADAARLANVRDVSLTVASD